MQETPRLEIPAGITIIEDLVESKACTLLRDTREIRCLLVLATLRSRKNQFFLLHCLVKASSAWIRLSLVRLDLPMIDFTAFLQPVGCASLLSKLCNAAMVLLTILFHSRSLISDNVLCLTRSQTHWSTVSTVKVQNSSVSAFCLKASRRIVSQ